MRARRPVSRATLSLRVIHNDNLARVSVGGAALQPARLSRAKVDPFMRSSTALKIQDAVGDAPIPASARRRGAPQFLNFGGSGRVGGG